MEFEELSNEALIANLHYHRALADRAMKEAAYHVERAKIFDAELKRRTDDVVQ
jgi:hypothetical protein